MRWLVWAVFAIGAVVFETSSFTDDLLTFERLGFIHPRATGVLVVFVALFAPRSTALWAAWLLGLLLELTLPRAQGVLVGPYTLGAVAAALVVLQLRTMVFRRRVLTIAVLTVAALAASGLVEVVVFALRSMFASASSPDAGFRAFAELGRRLGVAVCSGLLAVPLGWLLMQTAPFWGFESGRDRRR